MGLDRRQLGLVPTSLKLLYRLVIVFVGTVNAMPSLLARGWAPILISLFGGKN